MSLSVDGYKWLHNIWTNTIYPNIFSHFPLLMEICHWKKKWFSNLNKKRFLENLLIYFSACGIRNYKPNNNVKKAFKLIVWIGTRLIVNFQIICCSSLAPFAVFFSFVNWISLAIYWIDWSVVVDGSRSTTITTIFLVFVLCTVHQFIRVVRLSW